MPRGNSRGFGVCLALALSACGSGGAGQSAYFVYVRDAQGSVIAAVDDQGQKIWETHDDAFGLRLSSTGTEIPREFLDQPFDDETGFYRFEYRLYDPQSAQWLSPEPRLITDPGVCAEAPQKCNPYAYAGDRPGEWVDPDGRWADPSYQLGGHTYQAITLAFVGPNSESGAAKVMSAIDRSNKVNPTILADVRSYADPADAPASYTRVMWDPNPMHNEGRSKYDPSTSTLILRNDATTGDHALDVISHEIQHAFGGDDHYDERTMRSDPGFEHSIMGNFYKQSDIPRVSPELQKEEDDAKGNCQLNQGLTAPTPDEWQYPVVAPLQ